jgi:hypothetical protein
MSTTTAPTPQYSVPADVQVIELHGVPIEQGQSLSELITSSTIQFGGVFHPISTDRAEQDIKAAAPQLPGRARNLAVSAIADGWLVRIRGPLEGTSDRSGWWLTLQWPPALLAARIAPLALAQSKVEPGRYSIKNDDSITQIETSWQWDDDAEALRWVAGDDPWKYSGRASGSRLTVRSQSKGGHNWALASLDVWTRPSKLSRLKELAVEHSPVAVEQAAIEEERRERATTAAAAAFDSEKDAGVRAELRKRIEILLTATTEKIERTRERIAEHPSTPIDWSRDYDVERARRDHQQLADALAEQTHLRDWLQTTLDHEGQLGPDGVSPQYIDQVVERRVTQLADSLLTGSCVTVSDRQASINGDYRRRSTTYAALLGRIVTGVQISVVL